MKKFIIILSLFLIIGCDENTSQSPKQDIMTVAGDGIEVRTVEHDSHELIITKTYNGLSTIHKPNCKFCDKNK